MRNNKDVYIPTSIVNMDQSMVKVSIGTVLEQSPVQSEPDKEASSAQLDQSDAETLYQIERDFVLAKGSKSEVPEWARPALKYIISENRERRQRK